MNSTYYRDVIRKLMLLTLLIANFILVRGQVNGIKQGIKDVVDGYPNKIERCESFAGLLNKDFEEEEDKVGAIYYWIATKVEFNEKEFHSDKKKYSYNFKYKTQEEKEQKILKIDNGIAAVTFEKRKGTSKGFAHLFKKLCDNAGVKSVVVSGTSKDCVKSIGRKPGRTDHYWNAVSLNDKWYLVDVTWGAGSMNHDKNKFVAEYNETYYLTTPDRFFLKHFPRKLEWLLIDKSKDEFAELPLVHNNFFSSIFSISDKSKGVITSSNKDKVKLELALKEGVESQKDSNFTYSFYKDKKAKQIIPQRRGHQLFFEIPIEDRKFDYLTISYNKNALVTYKLKVTEKN